MKIKKVVEFELKERGIEVEYIESDSGTLFEVYNELTYELMVEITDYLSRLLECNIMVIDETND